MGVRPWCFTFIVLPSLLHNAEPPRRGPTLGDRRRKGSDGFSCCLAGRKEYFFLPNVARLFPQKHCGRPDAGQSGCLHQLGTGSLTLLCFELTDPWIA